MGLVERVQRWIAQRAHLVDYDSYEQLGVAGLPPVPDNPETTILGKVARPASPRRPTPGHGPRPSPPPRHLQNPAVLRRPLADRAGSPRRPRRPIPPAGELFDRLSTLPHAARPAADHKMQSTCSN